MNTHRKAIPSEEGSRLLSALRQAVGKALDTKRKLGQYAVIWQDGKPLVIGEDAPRAGANAHETETGVFRK